MALNMTGSAVITEAHGFDNPPYDYAFLDQPRSTCLSDGTYLVAQCLEDAYWGTSLARLIHVSADLTVLGQIDIMGPDDHSTLDANDYFYGLTIVGISGNHAFMVSQVLDFTDRDPSHDEDGNSPMVRTYGTWDIDCTSATPVARGPVIFDSAFSGPPRIELAYHWGALILYDPDTDRVVVAVTGNVYMTDFGAPHESTIRTVLQVFQASTGALLSETAPSVNDARFGYCPLGLWMDPADHTQFSIMVAWTPASSYSPAYRQFTVSLDGRSGSYDREIDFADSYFPGGGRSPYDGSGGGLVDSGMLFDLSYTQLTPSVLDDPNNVWWPQWSIQHGDLLDTYLEMTSGSYPYLFYGLFVRINLKALTAETFPLPYGPLMGYEDTAIQPNSFGVDAGMQPCYNPLNGDVAIFAGIYNDDTYGDNKVVAWKFEGPPDGSRLVGNLLGDRVRFTPNP